MEFFTGENLQVSGVGPWFPLVKDASLWEVCAKNVSVPPQEVACLRHSCSLDRDKGTLIARSSSARQVESSPDLKWVMC